MTTNFIQKIQNGFSACSIQSACRKVLKANKSGFVPYMANIRLMCEKVERPEYFPQIRNRMVNALIADSDLRDFVYISHKCAEDLMITNEGLCVFADILEGYFAKEDLAELRKHIRYKNQAARLRRNITQAISQSSTQHLKELLGDFKKLQEKPEQKEGCALLIGMSKKELRRRRIPSILGK